MTTNTISIQYDLSKEDLICSVCLDEITFPVIQCTNGNHFVCLTCFRELHRKCPVCRTSRLFHNKFLQTKLEPSMVSCSNQNCDKKVLPWSKESHLAICKYTKVNCFLCDKLVSLDSFIEHLKTDCDTEWFEKTDETIAGSATMVMNQLDSDNQYNIKLPDTKANVSFIIQEVLHMLK